MKHRLTAFFLPRPTPLGPPPQSRGRPAYGDCTGAVNQRGSFLAITMVPQNTAGLLKFPFYEVSIPP